MGAVDNKKHGLDVSKRFIFNEQKRLNFNENGKSS